MNNIIKMSLADSVQMLGTENAFTVLEKAKKMERTGVSIIHLELGESDFPSPESVKDVGIQSIKLNKTKYTPSQGILELREAIANHITETHKIPTNPDNVIIGSGAKSIIFYTAMALINKGDEVIYPNPGYPIYESMINYLGGKAIP